MQKKIFNIIMSVVGFSLGMTIVPSVWGLFDLEYNQWLNNGVTNGLIGAIIFIIISMFTFRYVGRGIKKQKNLLANKAYKI